MRYFSIKDKTNSPVPYRGVSPDYCNLSLTTKQNLFQKLRCYFIIAVIIIISTLFDINEFFSMSSLKIFIPFAMSTLSLATFKTQMFVFFCSFLFRSNLKGFEHKYVQNRHECKCIAQSTHLFKSVNNMTEELASIGAVWGRLWSFLVITIVHRGRSALYC